MSRFVVVALIKRENGSFDISFPDFPVVVATGESVDQAITHGRVLLSLYIKSRVEVGLGVPRLRTFAELEEDPEFGNRTPLTIMTSISLDYADE